jgi:hypothetical protein
MVPEDDELEDDELDELLLDDELLLLLLEELLLLLEELLLDDGPVVSGWMPLPCVLSRAMVPYWSPLSPPWSKEPPPPVQATTVAIEAAETVPKIGAKRMGALSRSLRILAN